VGLECDPLSLVRLTEGLREWKSSGSDLENRDCRTQGTVVLTARQPVTAKVGTNFAAKQRPLSVEKPRVSLLFAVVHLQKNRQAPMDDGSKPSVRFSSARTEAGLFLFSEDRVAVTC
jgi:hypothetical protein